jgi:hypothetical protein
MLTSLARIDKVSLIQNQNKVSDYCSTQEDCLLPDQISITDVFGRKGKGAPRQNS